MNQAFTEAFKSVIKELGLVRSGKLYNETTLDASVITQNENIYITINAKSPEYLEYLVEFYPIIQNWQQKPEVSNELTALIKPIIENRIQQIANGENVSTNFIPQVNFTINGV